MFDITVQLAELRQLHHVETNFGFPLEQNPLVYLFKGHFRFGSMIFLLEIIAAFGNLTMVVVRFI